MEPSASRPTAATLAGSAGVAAGLVAGLVGVLVLGPLAGLVALVVGSVAVAVALWLGSGLVVLRLAGGQAPALGSPGPARLANLVQSLSVAVGISPPALRVVDDPAPNALVTGVDSRRATLVVTSGLLDRLDRLGLEAVVAQQLAIIRGAGTHRRDVAVTLLAAGGRLVPPLARLLAGAAAADPGADIAGVTLTRYPPGLLRALEAVAAGPEVVAGPPAIAPLWFAPPASSEQLMLRLETMRELV